MATCHFPSVSRLFLSFGKITEKSIYIGYRERENDLGFSILLGYNFYDFKQEDKDIKVDLNKRGFFINFGYPYQNDRKTN